MDARLQADNLSLSAHGPVDADKKTSNGLDVSLIVNNLAKVVPQPIMGRGQITGVLSGSADDLRMSGQGQIADLEFLNYRLARAAGPVSLGWRKRQLTIQASAVGSGASGSGVVAAAGGRPQSARLKSWGCPMDVS